ncbi:DMT family transporter [Bordetella genomosp. 12]|uniref:EamA family transporter n=1 Tax=Bordetella genomosp. 12 TaxID=463035 RepID=A0A261VTD8_9BORD|nr:DMT family transporter [Bordetella genomosp. 12]OZI77097.1 EamA family transporter [Bordetella genomosp. 12]
MKTCAVSSSAAAAPERTAWGAIALFCVLWSSAFAAAKIAVRDCPPLTLLAIRFCIAGVLMMGMAALTGGLRMPARRDLLALIGLGLLNNALYLGLSWSGMATLSSAFTSVLISTNPLLIGMLAGPVLGERLGWRKLVGLLLGLGGVVIVLRSRLAGAGAHEDVHGTLLVLGGLIALVAGTLAYKKLKPAANLWMATGVQALAAGVALWPFALHYESLTQARLTLSLVLSMGYTIVAVSMGSYYLWFLILGRSSATSASALHFLMPPLGLFFGWLILREPVSWLDMLGIVPIAFGIWLATRRNV